MPMIDVFVQMPGASPAEVEQRVTRPMEKLLWEIPGVEYVYSTSSPGLSMVIVRFLVGEDEEQAIVRLNQKLAANIDIIPPGASPPLVKPRSIDDVPVMALTLWGERYADVELRRVAEQLHDVIKEVPDVSEVTITGGRRRQVTVELDPARLAVLRPRPARRAARHPGRQRAPARRRDRQRRTAARSSRPGAWIDSVARARERGRRRARRALGVAARRRRRSATRTASRRRYVAHHAPDGRAYPAVTISIAKRKGINAIDLTRRIAAKLDTRPRRPGARPTSQVTVTRNYGETAAQKSNELLWHMFLAVVSVVDPDLARARPARVGRRAGRHPGHARADAVRLLPLRLHAEPHHAVRADLLDRHPGRRRDRRRREHRAPRAAGDGRARRRSAR